MVGEFPVSGLPRSTTVPAHAVSTAFENASVSSSQSNSVDCRGGSYPRKCRWVAVAVGDTHASVIDRLMQLGLIPAGFANIGDRYPGPRSRNAEYFAT